MESFSIVKRGYNPQEVDEYVSTLEQVIKSYKDKDNAIKNAIISAQVAADNILKNAHLEVTETRERTLMLLGRIHDSVDKQRAHIQAFSDDYNEMVRRYMKAFDESDINGINQKIDELEDYLRQLSNELEYPDSKMGVDLTPVEE